MLLQFCICMCGTKFTYLIQRVLPISYESYALQSTLKCTVPQRSVDHRTNFFPVFWIRIHRIHWSSISSGSGYRSGSKVLIGTKKWKKYRCKFFFLFWIKNLNLFLPSPFLKDVKATGEAFSPQKRTSCTSKNEIY